MQIETQRLLLREFTLDDFTDVHAYASQPETVRYMDWGPNTPEQTHDFLHRKLASQQALPRGEYELAAGDIASARQRLDTLAGFANDGLMIPEQVWDREESPAPSLRFGAGTGSATPLAWSMAQFIRLAMSIERGRNVETPRVVWERYGQRG